MNTTEKQTLTIIVEGEEVSTLKSAMRAIVNAETEIGFSRRYPMNEKEVKLIRDIEKQVNK